MNIAAFHLYNDYSGSPKVLKNILSALIEKGYTIDLFTSEGGILDELEGRPGFSKHTISYSFSKCKIRTIFNILTANLLGFCKAFSYNGRKDSVIYINTIMPWGAALGGRLRGYRVIVHCHENSYAKGLFYKVCQRIMEICATEMICVSESQASRIKRKNKVSVIPNALSDGFLSALTPSPRLAFERKRILMLSSLKSYKGTKEFCLLAKELPEYDFEIIINDSQENVDCFLEKNQFLEIQNLHMYSRQKNVAKFYNRASLVLNLSDKRRIVETFGLTAIEAMAAGLPTIVPTVGGISDLIEDGFNGYKIDVENIDQIKIKIVEILDDRELYERLASNSLLKSEEFRQENVMQQLENIIKQ